MSKTLRVFDGDELLGEFPFSPEQEAQFTPIFPLLASPQLMAMAKPALIPALKAAIADQRARGERLRDFDPDNANLRLEVGEVDGSA